MIVEFRGSHSCSGRSRGSAILLRAVRCVLLEATNGVDSQMKAGCNADQRWSKAASEPRTHELLAWMRDERGEQSCSRAGVGFVRPLLDKKSSRTAREAGKVESGTHLSLSHVRARTPSSNCQWRSPWTLARLASRCGESSARSRNLLNSLSASIEILESNNISLDFPAGPRRIQKGPFGRSFHGVVETFMS